MTYEAQLDFKQNKVRNALVRIGGFDPSFIDSIMEPIIGMEDPWRYRNKAQYPIGTDKDGNPIAGFYAGRTHDIIPVDDCLLGVAENKEILDAVLSYMKENDIPAYDEKTGEGCVRHVLIRKGFETGQIMVCLVITHKRKGGFPDNTEYLAGQGDIIGKLKEVRGVTSISVNINNDKTNVILGDKVINLWGEDVIHDVVGGIDFAISPLSFFQVNPVQMEKLYATALEYAGLTGKEAVWDLYCGIGSISLFMAKKARMVYGVEVIPQAIEDARDNANRNGLENVKFFIGKAEEVLPEFYAGNIEGLNNTATKTSDNDLGNEQDRSEVTYMKHPDVIVVDPPRKGCDEACLETMLKMQPERIVYVSCDPATLARDLKILTQGGYELKRVRPCDMFPHSVHVETVVLLTRQNT
jgi:23S rRNA (uracil1939-C5)-methyltransferase